MLDAGTAGTESEARERILDSSYALFSRRGVRDVTVTAFYRASG